MVKSLQDVHNGNLYEGAIQLEDDEVGRSEVDHLLVDEMGILGG